MTSVGHDHVPVPVRSSGDREWMRAERVEEVVVVALVDDDDQDCKGEYHQRCPSRDI